MDIPNHSLRVHRYTPAAKVVIEPKTARELELIENLVHAKSKETLFGCLNHCATPMVRYSMHLKLLTYYVGETAS